MADAAVDLLIETMSTGPEATVVADGHRDREFRKLGNTLRGAALHVVDGIVAEVRASGQPQQRQVAAPASSVLGPEVAAAPVKGIGNTVFAVAVADSPVAAEARAGQVAVWEWEIGLENLPPRLWLDDRWLNLTGTAQEFRDRAVYGPVDFFRPVIRLRDVVDMWLQLRAITLGGIGSGRFAARRDDAELFEVHWAHRCVQTDTGLRVRGICRPVQSDKLDLHVALIETQLVDKLLGLQNVFAAIGDHTVAAAPTFIKWLTPVVPAIGHGVSTGQTPAIHPDTLAKIPGWLEESKRGPITGVGMVRRGGGGWLEVLFHGDILDREVMPSLGIMLAYPGDVSAVDPGPGGSPEQR